MWRRGWLYQVFATTQVKSKHFALQMMATPWPLGHGIILFAFGTCLLTVFKSNIVVVAATENVTREAKADTNPSRRWMRFISSFKMEQLIMTSCYSNSYTRRSKMTRVASDGKCFVIPGDEVQHTRQHCFNGLKNYGLR